MDIENLKFTEKVELLKQLIDEMDITLTAAYGEEGFISSENIKVFDGEKIYIHTDICTG